MYKHSCRKCPIRNRCIEESEYTFSVRDMIQHAFANRTDTLATWGLLQTNCLLLKAEEEQEKRARKGTSTLTRRLRDIRKTKRQVAKAGTGELGKSKKFVIRRLPQARKTREEGAKARAEQQAHQTGDEAAEFSMEQSTQLPDYLQPVSSSITSNFHSSSDEMRPDVIGASDPDLVTPPPRTSQPELKPQKACWLGVSGSKRRIALPITGELVLGRFDAAFGIPPDVDLAYEDLDNQTVSRRHAKIVGRDGYHSVEDMGSRHGVSVNGERIKPGLSQPLKPGDRVAIGSVRMLYNEVPAYLRDFSNNTRTRHQLIVTPTGRKISIAPPDDVVIGRSGRYVDKPLDIDLSQDGEVAIRVSRYHATIHWRDNKAYLEDLGSGFGTRINGQIVLVGQVVALKPGDHIWLGGCVLAYDVEL